MVSAFFSGMDAMVAELKSHPYIVVNKYVKNKPASAAVLKKAAESISWFSGSVAEELYKTHNGFYLYWKLDDEHPEEELEGLISNYCEGYEVIFPEEEDSFQTFAKIHFLKLEEVLDNEWKKKIKSDAVPPALNELMKNKSKTAKDLKKEFFIFDVPGGNYYACFCGTTAEGQPLVIMPDQGTTEWQGARIFDLQSYFSLLLETRGMVEARIKAFYAEEFSGETTILNADKDFFSGLRPRLFDNWWAPRDKS